MNILIIDYAAAFADSAAECLQNEGFTCKATYTYRSGWEYLYTHANELSLVLLSISEGQQHFSAYDFLTEAKEFFPFLPIVLLYSRRYAAQTDEPSLFPAADARLMKEELCTLGTLGLIVELMERSTEKRYAAGE